MNKKLFKAYIVGSIAGIVSEVINNPKHWCITHPGIKALATCTVFNMYGYAAVLATLAFDNMGKKKVPWWVQVLLASSAVIGMEAVGGRISKVYHKGKQTWKYPKSWVPFAGGSISIVSSVYFTLGVTLFYFLVYKPFFSSAAAGAAS
jgi:hypothetical protein